MLSKKKRLESRKRILLLALVALAAFFLGSQADLQIKTPKFGSFKTSSQESLTARKLKEMLQNKNFTLINVHTPYEREIIKTDYFISYDEILVNKEKLPKDKASLIVLYCKTGRMSAEALQTFKSLGYKNVAHLEGGMEAWEKEGFDLLDLSGIAEQVLPKDGFTLPVSWGKIGPRLVELGVIDVSKFENAVKMTEEQKRLLTQGEDALVKIDIANGQFVVDLLWALGLAQKSIVYEEGPMGKEYKDRVGNFASTGGWSLAKGSAVSYLGKYNLIDLSQKEQERIAEVVKNIYRPCCGNSTWFPDCNHGMAALAAVELMVDAGLTDEEIYINVLKLNSFWFPETYLTTATYFARQGISWDKVDAKEVLGQSYSSASGAGEIYKKVGPLPYDTKGVGGSCGA